MANEAAAAGTRPVRIAGDIGEKLIDLLEFLRVSSADYLDPLVRTKIEADHQTYEVAITTMRQARAKQRAGSSLGSVEGN